MGEHKLRQYSSTTRALTTSDLIGCRLKPVMRHWEQQHSSLSSYSLLKEIREEAQAILDQDIRIAHLMAETPTKPLVGTARMPTRSLISRGSIAEEETLEAMAAGTRLIFRPKLRSSIFSAQVDMLIRLDYDYGLTERTTYIPVMQSSHGVIRYKKSAKNKPQPPSAVTYLLNKKTAGLTHPQVSRHRHKAEAQDSHELAMAHHILESYGFCSGYVGVADPRQPHISVVPAERVYRGLTTALELPLSVQPTKIRECAYCNYEQECQRNLYKNRDVSLLFPGSETTKLREQGINSLDDIAQSDPHQGDGKQKVSAEKIALVRAYYSGLSLLSRGNSPSTGESTEDNEDYEIDLDMEADSRSGSNRGTFLWGVLEGGSRGRYFAFEDYSPRGDQGKHVAMMWQRLKQKNEEACRAGRKLTVYCFSEQGENYYLRRAVRQWEGKKYTLSVEEQGRYEISAKYIVMPSVQDIEDFIAGDQWQDVYKMARNTLIGTGKMGLKELAPHAGFHYREQGMDGRQAALSFPIALGNTEKAENMRRKLKRYNEDDCRATATVRAWLRAGAPGISKMEEWL